MEPEKFRKISPGKCLLPVRDDREGKSAARGRTRSNEVLMHNAKCSVGTSAASTLISVSSAWLLSEAFHVKMLTQRAFSSFPTAEIRYRALLAFALAREQRKTAARKRRDIYCIYFMPFLMMLIRSEDIIRHIYIYICIAVRKRKNVLLDVTSMYARDKSVTRFIILVVSRI